MIVGAIGDALLASSIVDALKRTYPAAAVVLLLSEANQGVGPLFGSIDEVHVLKILKPWLAIGELRSLHIELLVDANQWCRISSIITALSGCRYKVGFRTPGQFRHYAYDAVEIHSSRRHELENYRALARRAGALVEGHPSLTRSTAFSPEHYGVAGKYVVFHPWPSGYRSGLKEWPTQHWCSLVSLVRDRGLSIIVTGSQDNVVGSDKLLQLCGHPDRVVSIAGKLSLTELRDCLAAATAVVSINTGVMHLASLLGVPTVALNGPMSASRWGGVGRKTINLNVSKADGGAYLNLGFEYPRRATKVTGKISPSQVIEALEGLGVFGAFGAKAT